VIKRS